MGRLFRQPVEFGQGLLAAVATNIDVDQLPANALGTGRSAEGFFQHPAGLVVVRAQLIGQTQANRGDLMNVGNVPRLGVDLAELSGHAIGVGREVELVLSLHVASQGAQQLCVAGKDFQCLDADVDLCLPIGHIVVESREQTVVGLTLRGRSRGGRSDRLAEDFGRGGMVAQSGESFCLGYEQAGLRAAFGHVEFDAASGCAVRRVIFTCESFSRWPRMIRHGKPSSVRPQASGCGSRRSHTRPT